MKKGLLIFLAAVMLLSMIGCGEQAQEPETEPQGTIEATQAKDAPSEAATEAAGEAETAAPVQEPEIDGVDLAALYETIAEQMPEMIVMDDTMLMNFCGIDASECAQYAAAISYDGLRTDEIWLIQAVSEEALDHIEEMANMRLKMKGEETISYSPEQYKVVEKAQIIRSDMYLALIVSPDVDALAKIFTEAIGQ